MKTSRIIRPTIALVVLLCLSIFDNAQATNTTPLQNGAPVKNLSGATANKNYFKIVVPPNQRRLIVATTGGAIGDCDLYVLRNAVPPVDETLHDNGPTNDETVIIDYPEAGDWYVLLFGYRQYAGVTLTASYDPLPTITTLQNNVPVGNLSAATRNEKYFKITVPPGQQWLEVIISGGSGDADIYVKRGAVPAANDAGNDDYGENADTNNETRRIYTPAPGDWHILLHGYKAYSGLTLVAKYKESPPVLITGQWDFDQATFAATTGFDLEYYDGPTGQTATQTRFGTTTSFGILDIDGQPAKVMRFPATSRTMGYVMRHGAMANGGGSFLNQYTLIMDVLFPTSSSGKWRALLQTDTSNSNDADLFVSGDSFFTTGDGIGISGNYHGKILPNTWHRIVFAVDLAAPSPYVAKFIDGVKVADQTVNSGVDARWSLNPATNAKPYALLFADDDNETQVGFVNSIQFRNGKMSDAEIAMLGKPSTSGIVGATGPPLIYLQPQSRFALPGDRVTFTVRVSGSQPLSYQWQFRGENLAGRNSPDLTLAGVSLSQAGPYRVVVSNAQGTLASEEVTLNVIREKNLIIDTDGRLFVVDLRNGSTPMYLGTVDPPMYDIALAPSGQLYGVDNVNGDLYRIDLRTAATTFVGSIGGHANSLEFRDDGVLFAAGDNLLFILDRDTARPTRTLRLPSQYKAAGDLEFDSQGNMYVTMGNGALIRLNPTLETYQEMGLTGYEDIFGLIFGSDGNLYGFSSDTERMLRINLANGSATVVGSLTNPSINGIAGATSDFRRLPPAFGNVHAKQRPGATTVDLFYDLSGTSANYIVSVVISIDGGVSFSTAATHFTGEGIQNAVAPGTGRHVVWDAGADLGAGYFPNVVVRFSAGGVSAMSSVFTVNLRGLSGGLSVSGRVFDAGKGNPLAGATVRLGASSTLTDAQGNYRFPSVAVGDYTLRATKAGYVDANETVLVTPGNSPVRILTLQPVKSIGSAPRVTSITSKYPGFRYYLDGALHYAQFTATVDWAGHPPGKVQFSAPRKVMEVTTSGATAAQTFSMGSDFGPNGRLRVTAVSGDGARSAEKQADLVVAASPFPAYAAPVWSTVLEGNDFHYEASLSTTIFQQGVQDGIIPKSIPVFGDHGLKLEFIPEIDFSMDSDGTAQIAMKWSDWEKGERLDELWGKNHGLKSIISVLGDLVEKGRIDKRRLPHAGFGGIDLSFYPQLGGGWKYNLNTGKWQYLDAFVGLAGEFTVENTWPFLAGPVPMYAKVKFEVSADATAHLLQLSPLNLSGELEVNPTLRGSMGVGFDELLAAEGWIGGGVKMELQWPQEPTMKDFSLYVNAGATVYALLWRWEYSGFAWYWPQNGRVARTMLTLEPQAGPRLLERDYVHYRPHGQLVRGHVSLLGGSPGLSSGPLLSPTIPYSDPNCSAAGTNFFLVFLTDNTNRTSFDRTMAVLSRFNGQLWSAPLALADDGTADFHPRILAFPDGSAVAAWENERGLLPNTTTYDDMKSNLEISVAWFDRSTGAWLPAQRMTTNSFLDRSPKLAGRAKDSVLLTWVSNPSNDASGNAIATNQIWAAKWNGTIWSTAQLVAAVTNALVKYDLAYDGTNAHLVMSLDTVNASTHVDGRELFHAEYQNGAWRPLEQLTTDQIPDDNPQMAWDAEGNIVLTWLKGGELSSVVNFAMTNRQVLRTNEYSSNLADFKLATGAGGKLAMLWPEPSENDSDLRAMFYDPIFKLWGSPRQLTHDAETERGVTAAFHGTNSLIAIYNRSLVSSTNQPGKSLADLYTLYYRMSEDVALNASLFYSFPANPAPGLTATLHAQALNLGDNTVTNVVVAFYRDAVHPASEIGRVILTDTLPSGASKDVTFSWAIPVVNAPVSVFAFIDPEQILTDAKRSNNVVRLDFAQADLAIRGMNWSRVNANLVSVTARVANEGAIGSKTTALVFRQNSAGGTTLFSQNIASLPPGESIEVSFLWDVSALPDDLSIFAALDGAIATDDFNVANNLSELVIHRVLPPQFGNGQYLPDDRFEMEVFGEIGRSYTLEASINLVNWVSVLNFTCTGSPTQIVDATAKNLGWRFYRITQLPPSVP